MPLWDIDLKSEEVTNNSDKVLTVAANEKWEIQSLRVELITTPTVNDRQLVVQIRDAADDVILEAIAGLVQAASLTGNYNFYEGAPDLTAFRDTVHLTTPLPKLTLLAGYDVRVFDNNAVDPGPLGAEVVTNGDFATDTDWTKGTGWTISGGTASSDGTQGGDSDLTEALALTNNKTYEVTFTVSGYTAGNVTLVCGDTEGTDRAANGTFTEKILAGAGGDFDIRADLNFVGDIDNVSVKLAGDDMIVQMLIRKREV